MEKDENCLDQLKCIFCKEGIPNESIITSKSGETYLCQSCSSSFTFIRCFFCSKPLYFKNRINFELVTIKCPYKNCMKSFSISSCNVCKVPVYFSGRFPVQCPNKKCQNYFAKLKCPIQSCNNSITYQGKKTDNFPPYIETNINECALHNPHFFFQKMNCEHCSRILLWSYPDICIKGQKVICPYEDCKKTFNKVYCPKCYKANIFPKGSFRFNQEFKCVYCSYYFILIFCPFCLSTFSPADKNYIEGAPTFCPNGVKCVTSPFQMVNCIYCRETNIWKKYPYFPGQKIICANKMCMKAFSKIKCPFCFEFNIFPRGEFVYGKNYRCVYKNCNKLFSGYLCPKCYQFQYQKDFVIEGSTVRCEKCDSNFFNLPCAHCKNPIAGLNYFLRYGQSILCPYQNCQRLFNYFYCFSCNQNFYDTNNSYYEGAIIECPFDNCKQSFVNYVCSKCGINNFTQVTDDNRAEMIKKVEMNQPLMCSNEGCKNKFLPCKVIKIFSDGIRPNFCNGEYIMFAQPKKDPYEMNAINNFIDNDNYYGLYPDDEESENESQIENKKDNNYNEQREQREERTQCSMCLEKPSQSVFVPCGHRCVCWECGRRVMETSKKCPICQKESNFLLPRVYDS